MLIQERARRQEMARLVQVGEVGHMRILKFGRVRFTQMWSVFAQDQ